MTLIALQDLFLRHREKASGVWRLGKDPYRTVFLDHGEIVFAQSTHAHDRLTHLLVERGKLTQGQLEYTMGNLKPGHSIGKNLIEMGFITQRDLLDVARAQVERVVWSAMGTPRTQPDFESKELPSNVVRLPCDTPSLLLNGLLNLQDRERLLETLGSLHQVVFLEGRQSLDVNLPADLTRLLPSLDGARTLLEMARESGTEPLRVGAFALFLREMGWARLRELPLPAPLPAELPAFPEPDWPAFPEPMEAPPRLAAAIQAAGRPTTNLEHLSESLDRIHEEAGSGPIELREEAPPPSGASPDWNIITGRIEVPTTGFEFPPSPAWSEPLAPPEPVESPLTLAPPESHEEPVFLPPPPTRRRPWLWILPALLLLALGTWALLRFTSGTKSTAPVKPPTAQGERPLPSSNPSPAVPGEPSREAPATAEKPGKALSFSPEERLASLRGGDIQTALDQSARYLQGLPKSDWTLRLEIACQGETLQKAARILGETHPDLFLRPLRLKEGQTCYQVFLGRYTSRAEAEKAISGLPELFKADRPRVFQIGEIPE